MSCAKKPDARKNKSHEKKEESCEKRVELTSGKYPTRCATVAGLAPRWDERELGTLERGAARDLPLDSFEDCLERLEDGTETLVEERVAWALAEDERAGVTLAS